MGVLRSHDCACFGVSYVLSIPVSVPVEDARGEKSRPPWDGASLALVCRTWALTCTAGAHLQPICSSLHCTIHIQAALPGLVAQIRDLG